MTLDLDRAIIAYVENRDDARLHALFLTVLVSTLVVPVGDSEPVVEFKANHYDVSVTCIRTETGAGAVPVFSSVDHLLAWQPDGCNFISQPGRNVLTMVQGMRDISLILFNPGSTPRGVMNRAEIAMALAMRE